MIYRYIYKITCTAGSFKDKFYFGQRITKKDPYKDNYKGSGRKIRDYYKKYPNDYIKEIIAFYDNDEDLNKAEYDIIHPFLNNQNCLNLKDGGNNGTVTNETKEKCRQSQLGKTLSPETKHKMSISRKGNKHGFKPGNKINLGRKCTEETKKKISEANTGRKFSEEAKRKISESLKGKNTWSKGRIGPNLGRCWSKETKLKISKTLTGSKWMSNTISRVYVKPDKFDEFLQLGFHFGMK